MRGSSASWSAHGRRCLSCSPSSPALHLRDRATWSQTVPRGFIPTLDQGYAIVVVQLPDGASLSRTDAVVQQASEIIQNDAGRRRRRRLRRLLRRHLHQRQQCRRGLRALRVRSRNGWRQASRRPDHRHAVRQPAEHPGSLHHRHAAAADPRHRQCRRLQDAAPGAQQRRHAADPAARLRRSPARPTRRPA